jgi:aromatic-L-amino-acid decarboxylase
MTFEEFRKHGHIIMDWMADYLATIEGLPVRSQVTPGQIQSRLAPSCPEAGEAMEAIFSDFKDLIMPGITHWQHPRFFAYFNANSSPPSVLAEMLTATLAAQCMLWETSPAATELEERVMQWLRELIGLPAEFTGCIQDSASAANLCALIAAREKATAGRASQDGLGRHPTLTVYASAEAHSSVEKAARIAGIGSHWVRKIAVLEDFAMDPAALSAAIQADRAAGHVPTCVVACFGATGLGSIDPIEALGEIARAEGIYLHVDGAWAGSALILPEIRELLSGVQYIDSFVFNPHKWLFTNFDCSAFFMRDPAGLTRALSLTPAFLESPQAGSAPEYRDWSVALGRRFRALKLWFVLRSYGAQGLRHMIRNHIAWTQQLAALVRQDGDFELVTGPTLAMLTFRYQGKDALAGEQQDELNEELLRRLNDGGFLYLTKTRVKQRLVIRFVIGQTYTTWRHVEDGWRAIQSEAAALRAM